MQPGKHSHSKCSSASPEGCVCLLTKPCCTDGCAPGSGSEAVSVGMQFQATAETGQAVLAMSRLLWERDVSKVNGLRMWTKSELVLLRQGCVSGMWPALAG